MEKAYKAILQQMVKSGKRLRGKVGTIRDIGVTKQYLTEEDIRIERELEGIVHKDCPEHMFFAEEEHGDFIDAEDVWVVDPISGTRVLLEGLPHYGIVVSHVYRRRVQFAAVYDPSAEILYTAQRNKGAYRNGQKVSIQNKESKNKIIVLNISQAWKDSQVARELLSALHNFTVDATLRSHAVNDCLVAGGAYNGSISLTKDSFPNFATSLIVQEAGGQYTNIDGAENVNFSDRVFLCGDQKTYAKLRILLEKFTDAIKAQIEILH